MDSYSAGDDIIVDRTHRYTVLETRHELTRNGLQLMLRVCHLANGTKHEHWLNAKRAEPITPRLFP
jgi:hypothetical protein